ncbi:MAG: O-antigen ligase family protein [Methylococcaceae bacterium]
MFQLITVLLGLTVVIETGFIVARRPSFAAVLILGKFAFNAAGLSVKVSIGGINVVESDALCIALVIAIILRGLRSSSDLHASAIWFIFIGFTVLGLVRGVATFGFQPAVNDMREHIYLFVTAAYFASFRPRAELIGQVLRRWGWTAVVLCGIAAVFWLQNGFGTYADSGERALISSTALIVAQAAVIMLFMRRNRAAAAYILPIAFLVVVVLTQQRTVWLSTVAGFIVLVLTRAGGAANGKTARRRARVVTINGIAVIALLMVAGPTDVTNSLKRATNEVSAQNSTLQWRFNRWGEILEYHLKGSALDVMVGTPVGQSSSSAANIRLFAFHNFYLQTITYLGALGLLLFLGVFAWILLGLVRAKRFLAPEAEFAGLLLALLTGQLVFMGSYSLEMFQGILLGLASSLVVSARAGFSSQYVGPVEVNSR